MGPVASGLLITDFQDESSNSLARYARACRSGPHLYGIISRHKPLPAILHSSHFPEHTVRFMPHCFSTCSSLCLECPSPTFLCLEEMYSSFKTLCSYHHFCSFCLDLPHGKKESLPPHSSVHSLR